MKKFYIPTIFFLLTLSSYTQISFEVISDGQLIQQFSQKETSIYVSDAAKHYYVKGFEFVVTDHDVIPREDKKMKYYYFIISSHNTHSNLAPFMLKTQELLNPTVFNMSIKNNICSIMINKTIEGNLSVETSVIELELPKI